MFSKAIGIARWKLVSVTESESGLTIILKGSACDITRRS
jgi:hypothetical protein